MKHNYLTLIILVLFAIPANAQWITLYEGGNNTSQNLQDEWGSGFYSHPDGSGQNGVFIFGVNSANNNCRMFYYFTPFGSGYGGIYKKIPGMENYASLRVKLQMTLPDTVGIIQYYSLNLDGTGQPGNDTSNWNHFGSDVLDEYVYLSNTNGDSSIYFRTDLLRGDSVRFSYDHVLIEADTTQMLSVNENKATDFAVYSTGSEIHISTNNPDEHYQFAVVSAGGKEVLKGEATGNSSVNSEFDSGIYFVVIEGVTSTTTKKVYIN